MSLSEAREALAGSKAKLNESETSFSFSYRYCVGMRHISAAGEAGSKLEEIINMNKSMIELGDVLAKQLDACNTYAEESGDLIAGATVNDDRELAVEARRGSSAIIKILGSSVTETATLRRDMLTLRTLLDRAATLVEGIGEKMTSLDYKIGENNTLQTHYAATSEAITGLIARVDG